ncbi:MAG: hypothetical protein ABIP74_02910 [Candidatus Saccharimonas sp.]
MIQINLIPDIKRELLRAQKMRRTAISISILAGIAAGGIVVALVVVLGVQVVHESLARASIDSQHKDLLKIDNIDNVLTLQNQLKAIQSYQDKRTMDSRLFDVLGAVNPPAPNNVQFSSIKLDPTNKMVTLEGSAANGYAATETVRKTILNIKVESGSGSDIVTVPLTDEVTIGETSYGQTASGSNVLRFIMSFTYPEGLFDNSLKNIKIVTPTAKIDVTDSKTRVPESLFTQQASNTTGGN